MLSEGVMETGHARFLRIIKRLRELFPTATASEIVLAGSVAIQRMRELGWPEKFEDSDIVLNPRDPFYREGWHGPYYQEALPLGVSSHGKNEKAFVRFPVH